MGACLRHRRERHEGVAKSLDIFPVLQSRIHSLAGTLSGGQTANAGDRGGALAGDPRILIIDEPSLGLAPIVQNQVREAVRQLSELGISILIVEQNVTLALSIASRAYIMRGGRVVSSGLASVLRSERRNRVGIPGMRDSIRVRWQVGGIAPSDVKGARGANSTVICGGFMILDISL